MDEMVNHNGGKDGGPISVRIGGLSDGDCAPDSDVENDFSDHSADEDDDADSARSPSENYAMNKEEACSFQDSIKRYSDECVTAQPSCMRSVEKAKNSEKVCNSTLEKVQGANDATMKEMKKILADSKHFAEKAAQGEYQAKQYREEFIMQYDKTLFTAMNGRDLFQSSLEALWTASEALSATNEMVHHIREVMGEASTPMKLVSELVKMESRVQKLREVCRGKDVMAKNIGHLSTVARKVTEMKAIIEEQM